MRGDTLSQLANKTYGLMVTCQPNGEQTLPFGKILTDNVRFFAKKHTHKTFTLERSFLPLLEER